MIETPFVHKIESLAGTKYVYDINTNEIFEVDDVLYDIVEDHDAAEGKTGGCAAAYSPEAVRRAVEEIQTLQGDGYFLPRHEALMSSPICKECIDDERGTQAGKLLLNVTEDCNLRCVYCVYSGLYEYRRGHGTGVMSAEVARGAISQFIEDTRKSPYNYISFYGGEPLLHFEHVLEMIDYYKSLCSGKRTTFHIDTNATLLTDAIIERIMKDDIYLQISLDGPKEVHDRYRVFKNGTGTFETIMRNMRTIRSLDENYYRNRIGISLTIAPPYRIPEINEFFASGDVPLATLMCNFVDPHDTNFYEMYCDPEKDMAVLGRQLDELKTNYIEARIKGEEPTPLERGLFEDDIVRFHRRQRSPMGGLFPPNGICAPGIRRFFISTPGDIYPCERVGTAFRLGSVFDGVREDRVYEIVDEYIKHSEQICSHCWALRICGICFALAKRGDRLDMERKGENCTLERLKLHAALQTYLSVMEKSEHAYDFVENMIFT
ncbi:MAG TPA: radical SAM protein [Patescibacteria group bacterium]|nr:radical SAM protein [Patescibacteria group bacterium]